MNFFSVKSRRVLYAALLLLMTVLWFLHPPFRSFLTRIFFLFTSRSREIMTGYLSEGGHPRPFTAMVLMVFQALIAPFSHEPLIFAIIRVFGFAGGLILSITGRLVGAWLCYDIANIFLSGLAERGLGRGKTEKLRSEGRRNILTSILLRIVPFPFDMASYLGGALRLSEKKYLLVSFVSIIGTTSFYAVEGGYLSSSAENLMMILRIIMSLFLFGLLVFDLKRGSNEKT